MRCHVSDEQTSRRKELHYIDGLVGIQDIVHTRLDTSTANSERRVVDGSEIRMRCDGSHDSVNGPSSSTSVRRS